MKWKAFQRIYRELVAENFPSTRNIIMRFVTKDKVKGSFTCKINEFEKYAWEIYEKTPLVVIVGIETKTDIRQLFKYILCANPEEIPSPNDNYYIKCFSLMEDESKDIVTELLIRQISNYIGDIHDTDNASNKNL